VGLREAPIVAPAAKAVRITLHGVEHIIPGWHMQEIKYVKQTAEVREALRVEFNTVVRKNFMKDLAENHVAELRDAGMSAGDIAMMKEGRVPSGYQVHHKLPLDGGGTNDVDNLLLMKNDPDHQLITNYQSEQTQGMSAGETRKLNWPMPDPQVRVWPKTPGGGAHPIPR